MCLLSFALIVTGTYRLRFLAGKTEGAERTGCWTPFNTRARMTHQPQLRGRYRVTKLLKDFYQKRTQTSFQLKEIHVGAIYYQNSKFGDGTLPTLAQSFSCSGTENNLTTCGGSMGYSTCYHGSTAGVRCFSENNDVFG